MTEPQALSVIEDEPQLLARLSTNEVVGELEAYRQLQKALDAKMPTEIMEIGNRKFRKKGYWRALRKAFRLMVSEVPGSEKRLDLDGDYGYQVTYRAEAPNGERADGDGACFASEKKDRQGKIIATEHNVRSHAHTRAFNRAVSNLVAFGEVSADELTEDAKRGGGHTVAAIPAPSTPVPVAPTAALPDAVSDGEIVKSVEGKGREVRGSEVHHITTSVRRYTCLDEQTIAMAQHAMNSGLAVSVNAEEKTFTRKDGTSGSYWALAGVAIIQDTVDAPSAEDIPF